ncbi:snare complex subunit [Stemphylium lycopersici]|uniref:Snare complex subunit n=1 Tax=Stemphylium lycopersici TaxID=183478 RepID=A0A364N1D7_STELY|nr:snare complex subunit [Stemphylium lycopersici]RAQ99629.1 snare complex subunit [Stemphylium lycopersici]RAR09417.1 snare complex subunit [Stemphylium lycopersici]
MTTNPPQLFLLADHIKLSLLERQRALSLNLPSNSQDGQISRSLEQLRSGIESLESQVDDTPDDSITSQLPRLRSQLSELTAQFDSSSDTSSSPTLTKPNDPSLASDFAAAQKKDNTKSSRQTSKSVRFSDNPSERTNDDDDANRAALFPYRDDPDPDASPDQSHLDNQQIHEYHSQVIQDQDDQLDRLGASISRQRELSMQIGDELDGHVMLLDDVEEGVDRHQAQFHRARGRLDRFSRKAKENWSLTIIVVLIIILVLLIVITK